MKNNLKKDLAILKQSFNYIKDVKKRIIAYVLITQLIAILTLLQPFVFGQLIDNINGSNDGYLEFWLMVLLLSFILQMGISFINSLFKVHLISKIESSVKGKMFSSVFKLDYDKFINIENGKFINHLESDIKSFSRVFVEKSTIIIDITSAIVIVGIMIFISPLLTLITLASFPISVMIFSFFGRKIRMQEANLKKEYDKYLTFLQESLLNFKNIRIFLRENIRIEEYGKKNSDIYTNITKKAKLQSIAGLLSQLIGFAANFVVILLGINLIRRDSLTIGTLVAYNTYSNNATSALFKLSNLSSELQEIMISLTRAVELMNSYESDNSCDVHDTYDSKKLHPSIEISDMTLQSNSGILLENASIKITKPGLYVLVGQSGTGKSTLFNAISKMTDKFDGKILVGGVDISELPEQVVRKNVCYIAQGQNLFTATLKENISFFDDSVDVHEIYRIIDKLGLKYKINSLEKDLYSVCGEDGVFFSEGEKQRICLSKALIEEYPIYLFDEITASLDDKNQDKILNLMQDLSKRSIVICSSHDQKLINSIDSKILIENKKIYTQMV